MPGFHDRTLLWITCLVIGIHLAWIGGMILQRENNHVFIPLKSSPMVVKTITLNPKVPEPIAAMEKTVSTPPPQPTPEVPKPTKTLPHKAILPKKVPPKKPPEKPKKVKPKSNPSTPAKPIPKVIHPPPKENLATPPVKEIEKTAPVFSEQQKVLLAKAQENIAKMNQKRDPDIAIADAIKVPGKLTEQKEVSVDSTSTTPESGYQNELISRLRLQLRLPEFGDVQIKLTVNRAGKVVSVTIVKAASEANRKYVEKQVPALSFPAFGSYFSGKTQNTFTITLSNEL